MAFAADNNGGNNNGNNNGGMKNDQTTTGSINDPNRPDIDDAQKCRDHVAGGPLCNEQGTSTDMQQ